MDVKIIIKPKENYILKAGKTYAVYSDGVIEEISEVEK